MPPVDAVTPADSAPAEVEAPSIQERLNHATSEELATWRAKGDIPAVKVQETPKPAESAAAPKSEPQDAKPKPDGSAPSKSDTAAASPAAPVQKPESRSDRRFRELSKENQTLRDRLEAIERTTSQPAEEKRDTKTEPQPVAAKTEPAKTRPKLSDTDPKTGKPFASIDAWQDAVDEWKDQQIEAKLSDRLAKVEQERTQTEQQRSQSDEIFRKSESAMKKYADFKDVVTDPNLPIPAGSPVDLFIKRSANPGEVLYYVGKHPELLSEFYGFSYDPATKAWDYKGWDFKKPLSHTNVLDPITQVVRLAEIERELSAPPKKEEPATEPPANPRPPKLPAPPTEVSGRRAAPGDEAEAALARGDNAAYMRIMNARDIKAARA